MISGATSSFFNGAIIWMEIADLAIVSEYMNAQLQVGLYLYTPSVGIGNPADWDWFVLPNVERFAVAFGMRSHAIPEW
jgi:hypothetical protein